MSRKTLGPWARLSAKVYQDDDWLDCGKDARLVFLTGIAIAKDLNDNGRVNLRVVIGAMYGVMEPHEVELAAAELVDHGLWSNEGNGRYLVRSFLKWNESTEDQDAARERKIVGAHRTNHRLGRHASFVDGCPTCLEESQQGVSPGQGADASSDAIATEAANATASQTETETETETETLEKSGLPADSAPVVSSLCDHLADRIEAHREGDRPAITARWHTDMDKLIRLGPLGLATKDPKNETKIRASIDAIFDSLADPDARGFCWADQVRSAGALRKHWVQMAIDLKRQKQATNGQTVRDQHSTPEAKELALALAALPSGEPK